MKRIKIKEGKEKRKQGTWEKGKKVKKNTGKKEEEKSKHRL